MLLGPKVDMMCILLGLEVGSTSVCVYIYIYVCVITMYNMYVRK